MKKLLFALLTGLAIGSAAQAQQKKPAAKKPAAKPAATTGALAAQLKAGKAVYVQNCLSCHMADGGGVSGMNPPLSKTSYVLGDKYVLIYVLLNGLQDQDIDGEPYRGVMPAQTHLTNQQIADVLTYVRNSFGNKASAVTAAEVRVAELKQ